MSREYIIIILSLIFITQSVFSKCFGNQEGTFCSQVFCVASTVCPPDTTLIKYNPKECICCDICVDSDVIVGATNGLGRAFANIFGKKGLNIVLIDKKESTLQTEAFNIESKYNIKTKIICTDFTITSENYRSMQDTIKDLDIGILVNNLHENFPYPDLLINLKQPEVLIANMINLNIYSVMSMCKLVLPGMIERHRGIIINISSFVVDLPTPMLSVYSACKAFVDKFSTDLMAEHQNDGVIVQSLLPGFIDSKWLKTRAPSWLVPSPETYLEHAMPLLGIHERTYGYYPHVLLVQIVTFIEYLSPNYVFMLIHSCMKLLKDVSIKGHL